MAHSCVSTSTSALRFNSSLIFSSGNSTTRSDTNTNLSLPSGTRRSRDLRTSVSRVQPPPQALNSSELWTPEKSSRKGIWSIRDDIPVPPSPYASEQGPPPMVVDRYQSAIGQLFQYRIIHCGGPVEDEMANTIVAQLLYLDAIDPKTDIILYINSPGGSVTAGMAIFDIMKHIRPDVSTVCGGLAASMGAFLLSAGTKGKRFSLPRSRIMIHQPYSGLQGDVLDMELQVTETVHHKANLAGFLAYHTGQPLETINHDTERDFFMSATEAKDYGIIDGVLTDRSKGLLSLLAPTAGQ